MPNGEIRQTTANGSLKGKNVSIMSDILPTLQSSDACPHQLTVLSCSVSSYSLSFHTVQHAVRAFESTGAWQRSTTSNTPPSTRSQRLLQPPWNDSHSQLFHWLQSSAVSKEMLERHVISCGCSGVEGALRNFQECDFSPSALHSLWFDLFCFKDFRTHWVSGCSAKDEIKKNE